MLTDSRPASPLHVYLVCLQEGRVSREPSRELELAYDAAIELAAAEGIPLERYRTEWHVVLQFCRPDGSPYPWRERSLPVGGTGFPDVAELVQLAQERPAGLAQLQQEIEVDWGERRWQAIDKAAGHDRVLSMRVEQDLTRLCGAGELENEWDWSEAWLAAMLARCRREGLDVELHWGRDDDIRSWPVLKLV